MVLNHLGRTFTFRTDWCLADVQALRLGYSDMTHNSCFFETKQIFSFKLASVLLSLAMVFLPATSMAGSIPFDSSGIVAIRGKSICEFSGDFYKRLGVVVGRKGDYSVEYRERDGITGIFLVRGDTAPDYCGTVLDSRLVAPKAPGDVVLFKCRIEGEPYKGWGYIVGTGDNDEGKRRFVTSNLSWTVDIEHGAFHELVGKKVVCDTTGYAG